MKRPYILVNEHGWFYFIDLDYGNSTDLVIVNFNNINLSDGILTPFLF